MKVRKTIHLPEEAQQKQKRKQLERYIPISPRIESSLPYFFSNQKPPTPQTWNENIRRWAEKSGFDQVVLVQKLLEKV